MIVVFNCFLESSTISGWLLYRAKMTLNSRFPCFTCRVLTLQACNAVFTWLWGLSPGLQTCLAGTLPTELYPHHFKLFLNQKPLRKRKKSDLGNGEMGQQLGSFLTLTPQFTVICNRSSRDPTPSFWPL